MTFRLEELRPRELEARLAEKPALVMALGTIEWHSHHLPLGLDLLKAQAIADRAARRCGAVLAPPAWWAAGGVPQPFTLRLPAAVTEPPLTGVLQGFAEMGFRSIVVVNGHYGLENSIAVRRAALAVDAGNVVPLADYELITNLGARGDHAGRWETALLLAERPELVDLDQDELPGVIGADPRDATEGDGSWGLEVAAEQAAAMADRLLQESARDALAAGLGALERLWQLRQELPRDQVPPVQTPAWIRHLEAFREGRWAEAIAAADVKKADPAA